MRFSNIGTRDLLIRFLLAGLMLDLSSRFFQGSLWSRGLAVAALIPLITAWTGFCPLYRFCALYRLLGINTANQQPQS
jgi:hypothetical protein